MNSASGDAHELGGSTEGTSRRAFLARVWAEADC